MTRSEYLYLQFSAAITFILAACKPDEKPPIIIPPAKKLILLNVVPETAIAGGTLEIFWLAENIGTLSVFTKIGNANWELAQDNIDSKSNSHKIQLPAKFEPGIFLAIKISGESQESIKENIKTENPVLPKSIEILKIEPEEAIAGETLKVFLKAKNIKTVLIELRNKNTDLLEIRNVGTEVGYYELSMPAQFMIDDRLSIKLSGDSINARKENIPTFNILKINTDDYPELKTLNAIQKISIPKGDVWLKRTSFNEMKAFSGYCTHAGCGIDFLKTENHFYCSCHGSKFDADGVVLVGPASVPLNQYQCINVSAEQFKIIY
ncbi:MAG: ubiquinol-cytochrome c reductase iron-sulfur subunit [Bacteroidia bacterium]